MATVRTMYFAMFQLNWYCYPQGIRELGAKQLASSKGLSGNIWGQNNVRKSSCEPLVAFIGSTKFEQAWEGANSEEFPLPTCVKSGFSVP